MIEPISNGESGLSVRNKLNSLIADRLEVYKFELDLTSTVNQTLLAQSAGKLFMPISIAAVVTELSGTITNSPVFTFSQLTGWSATTSLLIGNINEVKELTYIITESYGGRTAIDLNSTSWTLTTNLASGATEHKLMLIISGHTLDYNP